MHVHRAMTEIQLFDSFQVSEHASWSSQYYGRIIAAALAAVGTLCHDSSVMSCSASASDASCWAAFSEACSSPFT